MSPPWVGQDDRGRRTQLDAPPIHAGASSLRDDPRPSERRRRPSGCLHVRHPADDPIAETRHDEGRSLRGGGGFALEVRRLTYDPGSTVPSRNRPPARAF